MHEKEGAATAGAQVISLKNYFGDTAEPSATHALECLESDGVPTAREIRGETERYIQDVLLPQVRGDASLRYKQR